jgi:dihydroneopterin aldolase
MNKPVSSNPQTASPAPQLLNEAHGMMQVFVEGFELPVSIGIHPHEREAAQTVRISVDLRVQENGHTQPQALADVVCYEDITKTIRKLVLDRHIDLVETLAEEVAAACLQIPRVMIARIRVEKPDAIAEAASVGVAIERHRAF